LITTKLQSKVTRYICTFSFSAWNIFIEDIMVKDVKYISLISTYKDLQELLINSLHKSYPFVDSPGMLLW